jgi:hypothetical protein
MVIIQAKEIPSKIIELVTKSFGNLFADKLSHKYGYCRCAVVWKVNNE